MGKGGVDDEVSSHRAGRSAGCVGAPAGKRYGLGMTVALPKYPGRKASGKSCNWNY